MPEPIQIIDNEPDEELISASNACSASRPNRRSTIKLGCDPEFELSHRGGFLPARNLFSDRNLRAHLGLDGSSSTAELRTKPGTPQTIMTSLSRSIGRAKKICDNNRPSINAFGGAGINVPLGGHLHFSGVSCKSQLIDRLDDFVTIPLNRVSEEERRSKKGYGMLGETRLNNWGWEYRSPPSWLSHPAIAEGVLVAADFLANWDWNRMFPYTVRSLGELAGLMSIKEGEKVRLLDKILLSLENMGSELENIEIFRAWGKRDLSGERTAAYPRILLSPYLDNNEKGEGLVTKNEIQREILKIFEKKLEAFSDSHLAFNPAGQFRGSGLCVFIPEAYNLNSFPAELETAKGSYVMTASWERTNSFGLSWGLRRRTPEEVADIIWQIVEICQKEDSFDTFLSTKIRQLEAPLGIKRKGVK